MPEEFGGKNGSNLWMGEFTPNSILRRFEIVRLMYFGLAVIRMHLARKGLGLFNDLQNEHSVVGNFPDM